jgi:hypothetical protein
MMGAVSGKPLNSAGLVIPSGKSGSPAFSMTPDAETLGAPELVLGWLQPAFTRSRSSQYSAL